MSASRKPLRVVGLGEALFDVFPDRRVVGGAPLNVAVHAQQCGRLLDRPVRGIVASRVGSDAPGDEIVEIVKRFGMDSSFIQRDTELPTGQVSVSFNPAGAPLYEIEHPSAWDAFEADHRWLELAGECDAVCFGTLAQRDVRSQEAVHAFLRASPQSIRLFDVNLRQHFHNTQTLLASLEMATILKTNDQEAPTLSKYTGFADLKSDRPAYAFSWACQYMDRFGLDAVVLTRGERGTLLCTRDGAFESGGRGATVVQRFPFAPHADAVGAGDACAAGLLVGLLAGLPTKQVVEICDRMGAYVAGRAGATPELPNDLLS